MHRTGITLVFTGVPQSWGIVVALTSWTIHRTILYAVRFSASQSPTRVSGQEIMTLLLGSLLLLKKEIPKVICVDFPYCYQVFFKSRQNDFKSFIYFYKTKRKTNLSPIWEMVVNAADTSVMPGTSVTRLGWHLRVKNKRKEEGDTGMIKTERNTTCTGITSLR